MAKLLSSSIYAGLYYGVQRLRGGVDREQIARAARLLDSDRERLRSHVEARLSALHGVDRGLEWLRCQAPIDRSDLQERITDLSRTGIAVRHEWRKTSGSTGTPFHLVKGREMTAQMDAAMWAGYAWHGVHPGFPHARFWGLPLARLPRLKRRIADALLHRKRLDAFDLSDGRVTRFFHQLRRLHPAYAYGYPSLIVHFVERCRRAALDGRELGLRVVITTGELLRDESRAVIEGFFGCRVVNEYGCTESGVLGLECEAGTMHALPTAAYPEVIARDGSLAAEGETGEVVVTDLYGRVLPLVRYRLRDRGALALRECACGRSLPHLRVDSGRVDSFIQTPERGPVYDAILAYTVPGTVQRFRARQTSAHHLIVDIVPGAGFDAERGPAELRRRWEEALGPGIEVAVRLVDDLPHEASGKLRYFVPLDDS